MKIYIVQDEEGVSGVVEPEYDLAKGPSDRLMEARLLMTREINAAIEGALEGGATEIVVHESHDFILEELNSDARCMRGARKYMIDDSYDAVFIVGQHPRARTPKGVLAHTYSSKAVREMFLNGQPIGEMGFVAAFAGQYDVPVALVTGDTAVTKEALDLLGDVEVAAVKEGLGINSAICLSPRDARKLIKEKACCALERIDDFKPFVPVKPYTLKVEYFNPGVIERAEVFPGAEILDPTTVSITSDDFQRIYNFRRFLSMIHVY